jgi:hypothetical protein
MARTVPSETQATEVTTPVNVEASGVTPRMDISSVPVDIFNHFNVPLSATEKEVSKLKVISNWAKDGSETMGDALMKIKRLEDYLGYANRLEGYSRIWEYCKMDSIQKELAKKKESLRRSFNG